MTVVMALPLFGRSMGGVSVHLMVWDSESGIGASIVRLTSVNARPTTELFFTTREGRVHVVEGLST